MLTFWSTIGFLSCIQSSLLILTFYIPPICEYIGKCIPGLVFESKITLTMYQIARLQYCFCNTQINSKKYGYRQSLFIILYITGFGLIIFVNSMGYYVIQIQCNQNQCSFTIPDEWALQFMVTAMIWYIAWDFIVLSLYIYSIYLISSNQTITNNDRVNKIKLILRKIIILTVIYELSAFFIFIIFLSQNPIFIKIRDIYRIQGLIEVLLVLFMMHLMLDHNNDSYLKLISILNKLCCYCCNKRSKNIIKTDTGKDLTTTTDLGIIPHKNTTVTLTITPNTITQNTITP